MTRMTRTRARSARLMLACSTALLLAGCNEESFDRASQVGPNPTLPDIQQFLIPQMRIAKVVGWKAGETPTVPDGLRIQAFATGLSHPRSVYTLPNGDVLAIQSTGPNVEPVERPKDVVMNWVQSLVTSSGPDAGPSNRITLLRDTNGDGVADQSTLFLDHLSSPFGVALVGGDLYVANTDAIVRYPYREGDTSITAPGTVLTALPGGPINHHWTKDLVASPDGTKLYVGIGSNSNVTENGLEAERERAAIWEVDRATGAHRIFASGLRNPNGLSIEPQTKALWTVVNERDELGPNLVPDYMTSVKDGAFYGWPYSYYGQHVDPRVHPPRPDLVAQAIAPDYALSSHVAPLGMAFNTGASLTQRFSGGAFVGEHGSWNRQTFNGYRVVYIPFANGRPNGAAQDVVTGFLNDQSQARGRPVGLTLDKSGALLVADDVGNTVWRVSAANPS
jgi:glucose/arabinose dehydrogenase